MVVDMMKTSHISCPLCAAPTDHAYELFDLPPVADEDSVTHLGLTCRGAVPHSISVKPAAEAM
jgi:hypothetical protein